MAELYRDYFDVDPEYFPVVNASVIAEHPDLWRKFYPHDSFVRLLESLVNAINRKHKLSVWIEGAYGTGKSHAVLTAKKLLDANEDTVREYFDAYPKQLTKELFNKLYAAKSDKPILTVHRYGSDDITGEQALLFMIQECIANALAERGFDRGGEAALKNAVLRWLDNNANRAFMNTIMLEEYSDLFGGDDAARLIEKLNTYTGTALSEVIGKVMRIGRQRGISALSLSKEDVIAWVKDVVRENGLKAIVFFWDEATEYFRGNSAHLGTFQTMVEMSESDEAPFYIIPVTHDVATLFPPKDNEWTKIHGRFYDPFVTIELPENIAFDLLGKAMGKKQDEAVYSVWKEYAEELYERTHESRERVKKAIGLTDSQLMEVLPVHPFAALLLKYISSVFASDVRSMFSFIKDDAGDEYRGFQWFIDNYGPLDENPLLTIDMLWSFFYDKGRALLAPDVRAVLDTYNRANNLIGDEPRVLKTVLLMRAIRNRSGRDGRLADLMTPNKKNLDHVFEGTDLENGATANIVASLIKRGLLYQRPGTDELDVSSEGGDEEEIARIRQQIIATTKPISIIEEAQIKDLFRLSGPMGMRYKLHLVDSQHLTEEIGKIRNNCEDELYIPLIVGVGIGKIDGNTMAKAMAAEAKKADLTAVFVDATETPMGDDRLDDYYDSKARHQYWLKKKGVQAAQYGLNVKEILKSWKTSIGKGDILVYAPGNAAPVRMTPVNLPEELIKVSKALYPLGLETFMPTATDAMWIANQLKNGAQFGAGKLPANNNYGQFSSVPKDLGKAWSAEKYWEKDPAAPISKIKVYVDALIKSAFESGDRISIRDIYTALTQKPYGFMPVNETAFVVGFLLKNYADGSFSCSDGTAAAALDALKMGEIINEWMNNVTTPNPRYKDKYIVSVTPEMKAFIQGSAAVFDRRVEKERMEDIRSSVVRPGMKVLPFPMWTLGYVMDAYTEEERDVLHRLIDLYTAFANDGGNGMRSPEDIATEIGTIFRNDADVAMKLHRLLTKENSRKGMQVYLTQFEEGKLVSLAEKIGDGGKYLEEVQNRFKTDDSKWVWQQSTADEQIRAVILNYEIVDVSNTVMRSKHSSLSECVEGWLYICRHIYISYAAAKNYWQDLKPFMDILFEIKRKGELPEAKRAEFLQMLNQKGDMFRTFFSEGQEKMFAQVNELDLDGLNEEEIRDIFKELNGEDCFAKDVDSYQKLLKETIATWKASQIGRQLCDRWEAATGTKSPRAWSEKYTMPVLAMVSSEDELAARKAFNTVNAALKGKVLTESAQQAILFITQHEKLFEALNDEKAREDAFRSCFIGKYSILLSVDRVKEFLKKKLDEDPYDWYKLSAAQKWIEKLAQHEYEGPGFKKTTEIIDGMDASTAKAYLKQLIEKYADVGLAILLDKGTEGNK